MTFGQLEAFNYAKGTIGNDVYAVGGAGGPPAGLRQRFGEAQGAKPSKYLEILHFKSLR